MPTPTPPTTAGTRGARTSTSSSRVGDADDVQAVAGLPHTKPVAGAQQSNRGRPDRADRRSTLRQNVSVSVDIRSSNGLGPISLVLGIVGVLFGLFPSTFFIAAPLGVTGFLLGRAGH